MSKFYNIAHGTKELEYANNYPWPYNIGICFDGIKHPVAFSEGVGHGSAGCSVTAQEALDEKWQEHFEITNAVWLLPYIEKLVYGVPLPKAEILKKYYELNSKEPNSYESKHT